MQAFSRVRAIVLSLIILFVSFAFSLLLFYGRPAPKLHKDAALAGSAELSAAAVTETDAPAAIKESDLTMIAVGDNIIHNSILQDNYNGYGYDFTSIYDPIRDEIQAVDVAVVNQEAPLDDTQPASAYPNFVTPTAAGDALLDAGFDVFCQANNHAMDGGASAVYETIDYWREHTQGRKKTFVGMYENEADRADIRYVSRHGIKVGFLNYTFDLNGYELPEDNPNLVALIDRDKIAEEVARVNEECDFTVAVMHWGEEYQLTPNEEQEDLAKFLTEQGVGLIIGHHPHVCQRAEWVESDNGNRAFCVYSLGNFLSAQFDAESMLEGMLQVTLHRDTEGNITLENPRILPLMNHMSNWANYKIYRLADYSNDLAYSHSVYANGGNVTTDAMWALARDTFGEFLVDDNAPAAETESDDSYSEDDYDSSYDVYDESYDTDYDESYDDYDYYGEDYDYYE